MKTKRCDLLGLALLWCFQTAVFGAEKNGRLLGAEKSLGDTRPSFSTSPTESVLLLGDPTVARISGLTQRFFPAGKHSANPVLRRTEAWEGVGPYLWGNRLMQDEKTGELRIWYIAYDYTGNFYRWGYATSKDALHWTEPDLSIEKFWRRSRQEPSPHRH